MTEDQKLMAALLDDIRAAIVRVRDCAQIPGRDAAWHADLAHIRRRLDEAHFWAQCAAGIHERHKGGFYR